ncbi:FAD-dependent oxidoreductase, partial [Micromonospora tarensis]|uniref:FAD-dependent oxidoreductase n=1 Tax=Micromonospora tarensis TaxID=2806100 RepID=UPI0038993C1C
VRGLDALGLGPALRDGGHGEAPGGIRDRHGRWLSRVDAADMIRQLGTTALGVHRATLHRTLREALPAASLHTNATVEHVEPGPDRAEVRYLGPGGAHTIDADLVVAPTACAAGSAPSSGRTTPARCTRGRRRGGPPSRCPARSRPPSPGVRGPSSAWCRSATASSTGTPR